MSLKLTVHVHVLVLARIFFQGSAAMLESFSSLWPFLPESHSLSAQLDQAAHISLKGLPIPTSLTLAFTWLVTALN